MSADKDTVIARLRAAVPEELKGLPVWLCWRSVANKDPTKKPRKIPYYANGVVRGRVRGSSVELDLDCPEDRAQLVGFDVAIEAYRQGNYTGLGVALGEVPGSGIWLAGIDFDDIEPQEPRVAEVVAEADSYTETSPSGKGLKIFGLGAIDKVSKKEHHIEIYSAQRFFAVTGLALNGSHLSDLGAASEIARRLFLPAVDSTDAPASGSRAPADKLITSGRHNYLTGVAGRLQNKHLDPDELCAALLAHNAKYCDPPKPEAEVREIAEWAAKKTQRPEMGVRLIAFTLEDLRKPVREEKYLLPGMVPTEAYTLIAGALSSYKSMLLLNMIVWRATGYDLLGLYPGDLDRVARVGDTGPCVLASYEDTDWRIFARLQRILNAGAEAIRAVHGAGPADEFLALAAKNIRRVPLTGMLGMTLVYRMDGYIQPNCQPASKTDHPSAPNIDQGDRRFG